MGAVEGIRPDNLLEEVQRLVVHDGDVVGIPADRTADMQHQLRHEQQERSHHVAHVLGHLIMAGIERVHQLAGGAIAGDEVVRAHRVALETDAEELGFQAGLHPREVLLEDFVERLGENLAVALALHRLVLGTVAYIYPIVATRFRIIDIAVVASSESHH